MLIYIKYGGVVRSCDLMKIEYGKLYKNSIKKLKKRYEEQKTLELLKNHIKQNINFNELKTNPISLIYEYEQLKHELSNYHSFNLCKSGGKIRLIFTVNESLNQVCLEYVSIDHYKDFKNKL